MLLCCCFPRIERRVERRLNKADIFLGVQYTSTAARSCSGTRIDTAKCWGTVVIVLDVVTHTAADFCRTNPQCVYLCCRIWLKHKAEHPCRTWQLCLNTIHETTDYRPLTYDNSPPPACVCGEPDHGADMFFGSFHKNTRRDAELWPWFPDRELFEPYNRVPTSV